MSNATLTPEQESALRGLLLTAVGTARAILDRIWERRELPPPILAELLVHCEAMLARVREFSDCLTAGRPDAASEEAHRDLTAYGYAVDTLLESFE